jgi:hypothetical protein
VELAPFNPVATVVVHILIDGHVACEIVVVKFGESPKLTYATLLVIFVEILTIS